MVSGTLYLLFIFVAFPFNDLPLLAARAVPAFAVFWPGTARPLF